MSGTPNDAGRRPFFSRLFRRQTSRSTGARSTLGTDVTSAPILSLAPEAAALAERLPALVVQAERIASTVAMGQHGRRRAGSGETFWQYRPALPGEPVTRIDWRQSARSHRAYVRETEAETAQTVYLWCDLSASMDWSSTDGSSAQPTKLDRAIVLLLALATLLQNGGERVRLLTQQGVADLPPGGNRIAMKLALVLSTLAAQKKPVAALPLTALPPPHARFVIASDFLCPDSDRETMLHRLSAVPIRALLLHIIDPAERDLPYAGRVRFSGTEGEADITLPHVEALRTEYDAVFAEREKALRDLALATGHDLLVHMTDTPPAPALLALSAALDARGDVRGGPKLRVAGA